MPSAEDADHDVPVNIVEQTKHNSLELETSYGETWPIPCMIERKLLLVDVEERGLGKTIDLEIGRGGKILVYDLKWRSLKK